MSLPAQLRTDDWEGIRLVAFDVDGTLYRQRTLRLRMAFDLLLNAMRTRNPRTLSILRSYRRIREDLGDELVPDFENELVSRVARAIGCSGEEVRRTVEEWIDERPLRYLQRCRYPGIPALMDGMRRRGKVVGILSDYPAVAKLGALELAADFVVSAGDDGVGFLKPHPRGLQHLMAMAGATPETSILIGDRVERDGLAAERAGAFALIRSEKPIKGWQTFKTYADPLFAPFL